MKQADLNRAVARATGETVDRISRMGFGLTIVPAARLPRRHSGNSQSIPARRLQVPAHRPLAQAA
jgi:hypothetical protein